jgi:hypothetical protein
MSYGVPALNILADRPGADEVSAARPSPQPVVPMRCRVADACGGAGVRRAGWRHLENP